MAGSSSSEIILDSWAVFAVTDQFDNQNVITSEELM